MYLSTDGPGVDRSSPNWIKAKNARRFCAGAFLVCFYVSTHKALRTLFCSVQNHGLSHASCIIWGLNAISLLCSAETQKSTTFICPKAMNFPFGMIPRAASATRALFMLSAYFYGHGLYLHPANFFNFDWSQRLIAMCLRLQSALSLSSFSLTRDFSLYGF